MKYPVIAFPKKMFSVANDNTIVGEASEMENRHLQELGNGDYGFMVHNNEGQSVGYRLQRVVKDNEGEIKFWEFKLTDESYKQYPDWAYNFAIVDND